jgi:hypothetical protein
MRETPSPTKRAETAYDAASDAFTDAEQAFDAAREQRARAREARYAARQAHERAVTTAARLQRRVTPLAEDWTRWGTRNTDR